MAVVRSAVRSGQRAVIGALKANTSLVGLLHPDGVIVAGKPIQRPPCPYLQIGEVTESDLPAGVRTFDLIGKVIGFNIHIWSDKIAQNEEVLEIYEQMELSLHEVRLVVVGQTHLLGSLRLVTILLDPSNTMQHGVCRYEAMFLNAA